MRRALNSVFSHGSSAIVSLLLTIVVARGQGSAGVGEFATAYSFFLLGQIVVRESVINHVIVKSQASHQVAVSAGPISLIGLIVSVLAVGYGLLASSAIVAVVGISLHGSLLLFYSKSVNLVLGSAKISHLQDAAVVLPVLASVSASLAFSLGALFPIIVWASASALAGYVSSILQKYSLFPSWPSQVANRKDSFIYGAQGLASSGSVQLVTFLLDLLVGSAALGAVRTNSTLIGPANLIVTATQPLILRQIAVWPRVDALSSLTKALKLSMLLVSCYSVFVIALAAIGMRFGEILFGNAWADASPLLVIVCIDGVIATLGVVPLALHRVLDLVQRMTRVTLAILVSRIVLVVGGGLLLGGLGAALGFLAASLVATVLWWISYVSYSPDTQG